MIRISSAILAATAILAAALTGCRTTQANMNQAYVKAVEARDTEKEDSTIYTRYRREMQHSSMTLGADTVDVSIQFVNVTDGGGGIKESLKPYCVVVGQFKMGFNAKSMRQRLAEGEFPGAFVVQTREPYYFVVAAAFNEASEAVALVKKLDKERPIEMKAPCPFILQPSQLRR